MAAITDSVLAPVSTRKAWRGTRWVLYCGKAEDVLPAQPCDVRLLVTDPPYGIGHSSGWRPQLIEGDTLAGKEAVYSVLSMAVGKFASASQHLYVFGDWDLTKVVSVFGQAELVWDKINPVMGNLDMPWSVNYEHVQFAVGHKTSRSRSSAVLRKRRGAVLRHYAVTGTRASRHPTEKPVSLCRELVEMSSVAGDRVLDPYCGAGSVGVAALLEGRLFTGIELEPRYCAEAARRLAAAEQHWLDGQRL